MHYTKKTQTPSELTFAKQSSQFARTICNLSKLSQEVLLMAIGTIYTFPQKNKFAVDFSVSDFANAFHKDNISTTQFNQQMLKAVMFELAKVICYENMESMYKDGIQHYKGTAYPLFYKAEIDTSKNIHLEFNPTALENIQELKPYEIIEFEKAAKLRGKHAFNLYKYALSKQGFSGKNGNKQKEWWFDFETDLLKAYLCISKDKYKRTRDFQLRCIKEPIEEINNAGIGIHISYESIKSGRSIVGFHFECIDTSISKFILKTDSTSQWKEKQDFNDSWKEESQWLKMQEMFPDEWQTFYDEEIGKTPKALFLEAVARKNVYERMIDMGFRY